MDRAYIINYLAKKINATSYLEIGVDQKICFNEIKVPLKVGVDPNTSFSDIIKMTSDEFFEQNTDVYDLILIDGLHHSDQVYRDITNSLNCLSENGVIICHDLLPYTEEMQIIPYPGGAWTGDCWKAFVRFKQLRDDLEMYTVDADIGIGIITRGNQVKLKISQDLNYYSFLRNKYEWMNIYSLPDFYKKMGEQDILQALLEHYIYCPQSPEINFYIGYWYEKIGQTASAVSYYIRTADRAYDTLLTYEALLRAGICFNQQGCRNTSVEGMLQHAITLYPTRPEGYFYLSRFYEKAQNWFHSYFISTVGDKMGQRLPFKLRTNLDYPGFWGIVFERAVSSWWTGLCEESKKLFEYLSFYEPLDFEHKQSVISNLKKLEAWKSSDQFVSPLKTLDEEVQASDNDLQLYRNKDISKVKFQFPGLELIERNYAESFQDIAVLTLLQGKRQGIYLEIGAGYPLYGNNTYLLESKFDWRGLALDLNIESIERYFRDRTNPGILRDGTQVDYQYLLQSSNMPVVIDYLQLDCDPANVTYEILTRIPFDLYKFAVITYEHDHYRDPVNSFKDKSRMFLQSKGYELLITNVGSTENKDFEDWWIHPELVNREIVTRLRNVDGNIKIPRGIFLWN